MKLSQTLILSLLCAAQLFINHISKGQCQNEKPNIITNDTDIGEAVGVSGIYGGQLNIAIKGKYLIEFRKSKLETRRILSPTELDRDTVFTYYPPAGWNVIDHLHVEVHGNRLYTLGDRGRLMILDVSNPENISELGSFVSEGAFFTVDGDYAYVSGSPDSELEVFDVSNPANVQWVGQVSGSAFSPKRLAKKGNYIYANSDEGLIVYDVTTPSSPTQIDADTFDGTDRGITIVNDQLLVGALVDSFVVRSYNLAAPESPVFITQIGVPATPHQIKAYQNTHAYVLCKSSSFISGAITLIDYSTPLTPVILAKAGTTASDLSNIYPVHGRVYITHRNYSDPEGYTTQEDIRVFRINHEHSVDQRTVCQNFVWVDGNTYPRSSDWNEVREYYLTDQNGCDSTVRLELTYTPAGQSTETVNIQGSQFPYTWSNGKVYHAAVQDLSIVDTLTTSGNCDSLVFLDLSFTEDRQDQTITVAGDEPRLVAINDTVEYIATTTSGLPLEVSINQNESQSLDFDGLIYLGDHKYVATRRGLPEVTVSQKGNLQYKPASKSFFIRPQKTDQTITFEEPDTVTFGDPKFLLVASSTSQLPVSFSSSNTSLATINNGVVSIEGAGTVIFTASQGGDGLNWNAAPSVQQSLVITKADQGISYTPITGKNFGDTPFTEMATTPESSAPVSYTSSDTTIIKITGDTLFNIVGAGSVEITATVDSTSQYNQASVTETMVIGKAAAITTMEEFDRLPYNHGAFTPVIDQNTSGGTVSFSSSNTAVATTSGGSVTILASGQTDITVHTDETDDYLAAPDFTQTLLVMDLGLTGSTTDLSIPISGVTWDIDSTNVDPAEFDHYEGENLPQGLTVQGSQLVADGMWTGTHTFKVKAIDKGGATLVERLFTFDLPDLDFNGIRTNMYANQEYTFEQVALQGVTNPVWTLNNTVVSNSSTLTTTLGSGSQELMFSVDYDGNTYTITKNFNTLDMNFDVELPSEPIIQGAEGIYNAQISTNFVINYGFDPDFIEWDFHNNDNHVSYGNDVDIYRDMDGNFTGEVTVAHEHYRFTKTFDYTVHAPPTINIPTVTANHGDQVNVSVAISGLPNFTNPIEYRINECRVDGLSLGDAPVSINGSLNIAGQYTCQLAAYTAEGHKLFTEDFDVYSVPNLELVIPEPQSVLINKYFVLQAQIDIPRYQIESFNWGISNGQENRSYTVQNPWMSLSTLGEYTASVTVRLTNGEEFTQNKSFTVRQDPNFTLAMIPSTTSIYEKRVNRIGFKVNGDNFHHGTTFSLPNAPDGAFIDSQSGVLTWTPTATGDVTFQVEANNPSKSSATNIEVTVNISPVSGNSTFKVVNDGDQPQTDVLVQITEQYISGSGNFQKSYSNVVYDGLSGSDGTLPSSLNYYDDATYTVNIVRIPNPPAVKSFTPLSAGEVKLVYNTELFIQGFSMTFSSMTYDRIQDTYTFQDLLIHDQILIPGQSTVSGSNAKYAILKTFSKVKYKDATSDLVSSTLSKEYWLANGLMVAQESKHTWFNLGEFAGLDQHGVALTISKTMDTVCIAAFPEMPWVFGEAVNGYTKSYVSNTRSMIANPDQYPSVLQIGGMALGGLLTTQQHKFRFPEIDVRVKHTAGNDLWDFTMKNLTFAIENKLGIEDLTFIYLESQDYLQVGGKVNFPSPNSRASRNAIEEALREGRDVKLSVDEFHNYVQEKTAYEEVLLQSGYDEEIDITAEIQESNEDRRFIPLRGLGMSLAIKEGVVDSVLIRLGTEILLPSYGIKITELFGGLSNLSRTDANGNVAYNSNFSILAGGAFEDIPTGIFKGEDLHFKLNLFSSFGGSGRFTVFNFDVGRGAFDIMFYPRRQFLISTSTNILGGFIRGKMHFSAGYDSHGDFDVRGASKMSLNLPDHSIIPSPIRGKSLGSYHTGFTSELIGAKVRIGLESLGRSHNPTQTRGSIFCDVADAALDGAQDVVNGTSSLFGVAPFDVREKLGEVLEEIWSATLDIMSIEVGVGYNFRDWKILWGSDVKIPDIRQRATRGDTAEYVFDVTNDVTNVYIFMDDGGTNVVDFDVLGPNGTALAENINHVYVEEGNTSISAIQFPEMGSYTIKVDTTLYDEINMDIMMTTHQPTGQFTAPMETDTSSAHIAMKFNDLNDTLNVRVFVDSDRKDFNGTEIAQFKVLNNANVKFDYSPEGFLPGEYYFYYYLTDASGIPNTRYAPGSIYIPGKESIPAVSGLVNEVSNDSLIISWDALGDDIDFVTMQLSNQTLGTSITREQTGDTTYTFPDLKFGHVYEVQVFSVDENFEFSNPLVVSNITMTADAGQHPPVIVNYPNEVIQLREGDLGKFSFPATDADGDEVTYEILETLPKVMIHKADSIIWAPQLGEAGLYTFHMVISDGVYFDTIPLQFEVMQINMAKLDVRFGARQLYESDNMTFHIHDQANSVQSVPVYLINFRTKQVDTIVAMRVDDHDYEAEFQLSAVMASNLDVIDGDTILGVYVTEEKGYLGYAHFHATPQILDHTPPGVITDLEVLDHDEESLMLTFTTPQDSLDNGTIVKPWVYDLRFSSVDIETDELFTAASFTNYYESKSPGEKDTLYLEKSLIADFEVLPEIWFSIKSGDSQFNYGMKSNSTVFTQSVPARNVVATLSDQQVLTVNWEGTTDTSLGHFVSYKIFRSNNIDSLEYLDEIYTNSFVDSLRVGVKNGTVQYAVSAQYEDEQTSEVFSNEVTVHLYSDVQIRVLELDSGATEDINGLTVSLSNGNESEIANGTTNAFGYVNFPNTWNDDYHIEVMYGSTVIVEEDTVVKEGSSSFEFFATISDTTTIGVDELANSGIQIVPNPTSDEFIIRGVGLGNVSLSSIQLLNASGQNVASSQLIQSGENEVFCDVRNLRAGVYLLTIPVNDQLIRRKVYVK